MKASISNAIPFATFVFQPSLKALPETIPSKNSPIEIMKNALNLSSSCSIFNAVECVNPNFFLVQG